MNKRRESSGRRHEYGCAKCLEGYLVDKGHVVCYEHEPHGRDTAPDYIFTIDGEKYSVEVTEFKASHFHYLDEHKDGPEGVCAMVMEKVQEIRKDIGRAPQTGRYLLGMEFPLPKEKMKEEIFRVAKVIAGAEFPDDAIEVIESRLQVVQARRADTLSIAPGALFEGEEGEPLSEVIRQLTEIICVKKEKIERNEPDKPKILLIFGIADMVFKVTWARGERKYPELENAVKNFDCILLIGQENDQYEVCGELIPFNPWN